MRTFPEQQVFFATSFSQVISPLEFHGFALYDISHIEPLTSLAEVYIGWCQVIE